MTCGNALETKAERRQRNLDERDMAIVEYMRAGKPVAHIADHVGVDDLVVRGLCKRLAAEHNIDYKPKGNSFELPWPGLTKESARLRNHLGSYLSQMRDAGTTEPEIGRMTGIPARSQSRARDGSTHNWTLAQIERTARATGQTFKEIIIRGVLTIEDLPTVVKSLTPPQTDEQRDKVQCAIRLLNSSL